MIGAEKKYNPNKKSGAITSAPIALIIAILLNPSSFI
jgi:hypothetical protein